MLKTGKTEEMSKNKLQACLFSRLCTARSARSSGRGGLVVIPGEIGVVTEFPGLMLVTVFHNNCWSRR